MASDQAVIEAESGKEQLSDDVPAEAKVLLVDADDDSRTLVAQWLDVAGHHVTAVSSGMDACNALEQQRFDVVLLDLELPDIHGFEVLKRTGEDDPDTEFIVMTDHATVDSAVKALRLGAFDYITKPLHTEELRVSIERALDTSSMLRELAQLRRSSIDPQRPLLGKTPAMQRLMDLVERVARTRATVIISGETGTGKELVARAVHELSRRRKKRFVPVHCSAMAESLLESELFGHVKGSFTGAMANRRGLIEAANGGTLFLDEVGTIPQSVQVKLLRVLQERTFQRVGSNESIAADFRLIAATNIDLGQEVAEGRFREDLYYRLNVFPIHVPPLRERRDDIPLLAAHFRNRFAKENGIEPPKLSARTLTRMSRYDWPGNVRELQSYVERVMIMEDPDLPFALPDEPTEAAPQQMLNKAVQEEWSLERLEREYILAVLEKKGGNQTRAADTLGITRRTIYRRLHKYKEENQVPADFGV